jgi:hypothetical protein
MQQTTQDLIDNLKKCTSQDEVITMVKQEQQRLKSLLKKENLEFYHEEHPFPQDIVGLQGLSGVDTINNAHSYEEINYIRRGLLYNWTTHEEQDRFEPIRESVDEIIDNLD